MVDQLNAWLGGLFARENVDRTVRVLVESQIGAGQGSNARDAAQKRLADAEARLRRFQNALAAGVDPAAMVETINDAQAQRAAAQAELDNAAPSDILDPAEVYAMIDALGDVSRALNRADGYKLQEVYETLRLEMTHDAESRTVDVVIKPAGGAGRDSKCVRGGSCALTTRIYLRERD